MLQVFYLEDTRRTELAPNREHELLMTPTHIPVLPVLSLPGRRTDSFAGMFWCCPGWVSTNLAQHVASAARPHSSLANPPRPQRFSSFDLF